MGISCFTPILLPSHILLQTVKLSVVWYFILALKIVVKFIFCAYIFSFRFFEQGYILAEHSSLKTGPGKD